MRIFAIGDIHGCSVALERLLAIVPFRAEDLMITLGDYVDRGPGTRAVLERLLELRKEVRLISLRGNHEIMMLQARESRFAFSDWKRCGGEAALSSYAPHTLEAVPEAHWAFLRGCLPYYETERHLFVHANAYPDRPLERQPDYMLFWEHMMAATPHVSGKTIICGHTSQHAGRPRDFGPAVCIDTYAHGGGWLTCLDVEARHYWQANQLGATREGALD